MRTFTDGQRDRIPIANTRSQQYLPVQLSRVKILRIMFCRTRITRYPFVTYGHVCEYGGGVSSEGFCPFPDDD